MAYRTTRVVRRDGIRYDALKPIAFDQVLFDLGAIEKDTAVAEVAPPPPPVVDPAAPPKPLSAMKRAELAVEAEKSGVTIAVGMTNKQVVAAIEAAREPK